MGQGVPGRYIGWGWVAQRMAGRLSTLLELLMLCSRAVMSRWIKAASGFPRGGLAMLFRTWPCYSAVLRSKSR